MNVLLWCPYLNPGGGLYLLTQLVAGLRRNPAIDRLRIAVDTTSPLLDTLASSLAAGVEIGRLKETGNSLGKARRLLGIRGTGRLRLMLRAGKVMLNIKKAALNELRKEADAFDLVYVIWPHRDDFPDIGKPIVCTFQDCTMFDFPEILGGPQTQVEWNRSKVWIERCAQVVVSSHASKVALQRHFGASHEPTVIQHAIYPRTEASSEEVPDGRLPPKYVICPTNITPHKNLDMLLIAWSRFERRAEYPLVVIGAYTDALSGRATLNSVPAWTQARLYGLVNRLGLRREGDIYGLGYVADAEVMPMIKRAVALIMPTLSEGGGSYPIEEALNVGTPVLCSDIPVLREHVSQHSAQVKWFDPLSVDSMVAALNAFFDDYDLYKQSAVAGMYDPRPTWDDIAAAYVAVFKQVLSA
ncbi:MAG: glycosyltransferase [Anaerolineae bacterium]|nr:glycosyltransferase [Anaerolineae bacterium]